MSGEAGQGRTVQAKLPPEVQEALKHSSRVLGRYVLVRLLGKGGMGAVYRAWQLDLRRWVAVKLITGEADAEGIARFYREAQTAAKLQHPGIVSIFEVGVEKGRHFIAMEYVAGVTLDEWMRAEAPPGLEATLGVLRDVALAVDAAHRQGIIHRDLKPGNILVDKAGHAHVADFGLAKQLRRNETLTQTGMVVGTPSYMSPEQAEGESAKIDRRADVWSLGVVLYVILTGRLPFVGKGALEILHKVVGQEPRPPRKVNPAVAPGIEAICVRALAKKPSDRYASAKEFAEDIDRFLRGEAPHARPLTGWRSFVGAVRRRRVPIAVGAIILTLAVVASIALLRPRPEAPKRTERPAVKVPPAVKVEYEFVRSLPSLLDREKRFPPLMGRIEKIKGRLKSAIAKDPRSADAHYLLGRLRHITGRYRGALESYSFCLKADPKFVLAYHHRARLHSELALFGWVFGIPWPERNSYRLRAVEDAARSVRLSEGLLDFGERELSRAYDLCLRGKRNEALAICDRHKNSEEFRILAGIIHDFGDRHNDALKEFRAALLIRPWFFQVLVYQAAVQYDLEHPAAEALESLRKAEEIYPDFAGMHYVRGKVFLRSARYEEACRSARRALALDATFSIAYIVLALAYDFLNRPEESARAIESARKARCDPTEIAWAQADIHERRGRYPEAVREYSEAIRLEKDNGRSYAYRAHAALQMGDALTAAEDAEKAFALGSRGYLTCFTAGGAWYSLKKYDKAVVWYTRAIQLKPRDPVLFLNRAGCHLLVGNEGEALEDLRKVRNLDATYERAEVEGHIRRLEAKKKGRTP